MKDVRDSAREQVWRDLRHVARPDSRFHYNFAEFIADYEGGEQAVQRLTKLPVFQQAQIILITPDNNLNALREVAIKKGTLIIMPTYSIARGFLQVIREDVPLGQESFASTLDGMDRFARPISLEEIARLGRLDLLVTGASVVTLDGIRFGKGHGFFDLEWAMMREIGVVDEQTPVVAVAHDCQVRNVALRPDKHDTIVDYVITPTRTIEVDSPYMKPSGIEWGILPEEMRFGIPPLQQLYEQSISTS
jgi:5-formyltetrahydrofolate cyclo-ligase